MPLYLYRFRVIFPPLTFLHHPPRRTTTTAVCTSHFTVCNVRSYQHISKEDILHCPVIYLKTSVCMHCTILSNDKYNPVQEVQLLNIQTKIASSTVKIVTVDHCFQCSGKFCRVHVYSSLLAECKVIIRLLQRTHAQTIFLRQ